MAYRNAGCLASEIVVIFSKPFNSNGVSVSVVPHELETSVPRRVA